MSPENADITALLPLKEESERVPGKNFRTLGDRPLFRWVLDKLLGLDVISEVVINTDADHLLEGQDLPDDSRLTVRERPEALRGHEISMNRIIEDDLGAVGGDVFLQTHATNPFLGQATLRECIETLDREISNNHRDSLFSVTPHQARFYTTDRKPINHDPDELLPTQELDPVYEENSNVYLFTRDSFRKRNQRIGENPALFPVSFPESLDIDEKTEWEIATVFAGSDIVEPPPPLDRPTRSPSGTS